jgi:hypothetical protein
MNDRNRSPFEEINVKPITTDKVDPSNYTKGAYLQPLKHQRIESNEGNEGDKLAL